MSGRASALLLLQKKNRVKAADRKALALREESEIQKLLHLGLELVTDNSDLSLQKISLIVLSPGIERSHPLVQKGVREGIEIVGEVELALRFLPDMRMFGITGSNGKTTTVLLTAHILNGAGIPAVALGNVGTALSLYAANPHPQDTLVIELSSFQLETMHTLNRFDVGIVLNLTPNHLNRHASMQEYAEAKLRLGSSIKQGGHFYVSQKIAKEFGSLLPPFTEYYDACRGKEEGGSVAWENVAASQVLCNACHVGSGAFAQGLKTFQKPPHRLEWVAEIEGVAYYNDSKASNVDAVMHAMQQFKGRVILIAGGVDKGSSYCPWIASFGKKIKKMIVFGEAASKMERELAQFFLLERALHLQEAFAKAKHCLTAGDTVLFSPGCSSYDQFVNYEQRGNAFKKLVLER
ncbi:MAG: UDP-N-acetylmuramoyl-L-alanine--D-glutamate ligase [Chlamydiia bacterium]|nr:UDP-N-acetylmuramoyl-L-alanine--D-glutamate ligase [Chlamydiia bacterium]